ncbi:MAG: kelch repeat-containing protein, partial [Chthoniobacterales bacterium]
MLRRCLALPLFLLFAALLAQPCAATPFQWDYTGSLNDARKQYAATLLPDGRVLVAGGYNDNNGILASAELYDPVTGTWTYTGSLSTG